MFSYCVHRCLLVCYVINKMAWQVFLLALLFCSKRVKVCNICVNITVQVHMSRWILWFHLHDTMCLKTQCTTEWINMYSLQSANIIKMHHRTAIPLTTQLLQQISGFVVVFGTNLSMLKHCGFYLLYRW